MAAVVTGALAVVRDSTGKLRYYYQGSQLPDDLPGDEVQRLVDRGLVTEIAEPDELSIGDLGLDGVDDEGADDEDGVDDEVVERPKRTANKAVWAEYRGLTEEEAEDVTLQQLQDDDYMASYRPAGS